MKIISKTEAKEFKNGPTCTAFEYEAHDTDINIARIHISGRYPAEGRVANMAVTQLAYVEEGQGKIMVGEISRKIQQGDVVALERNERFFWEGSLTLIVACAPAWTPEQYLHEDAS